MTANAQTRPPTVKLSCLLFKDGDRYQRLSRDPPSLDSLSSRLPNTFPFCLPRPPPSLLVFLLPFSPSSSALFLLFPLPASSPFSTYFPIRSPTSFASPSFPLPPAAVSPHLSLALQPNLLHPSFPSLPLWRLPSPPCILALACFRSSCLSVCPSACLPVHLRIRCFAR